MPCHLLETFRPSLTRHFGCGNYHYCQYYCCPYFERATCSHPSHKELKDWLTRHLNKLESENSTIYFNKHHSTHGLLKMLKQGSKLLLSFFSIRVSGSNNTNFLKRSPNRFRNLWFQAAKGQNSNFNQVNLSKHTSPACQSLQKKMPHSAVVLTAGKCYRGGFENRIRLGCCGLFCGSF